MAPLSIDNNGQALLIFETEAAYRANSVAGFWGPVSSSIDWCEHNYVISPYVAEFFNTLSNVGMIILGLLGMYFTWREGLETRYIATNTTLFLIGLGSAAFHGASAPRAKVCASSDSCSTITTQVRSRTLVSKATRRPWSSVPPLGCGL